MYDGRRRAVDVLLLESHCHRSQVGRQHDRGIVALPALLPSAFVTIGSSSRGTDRLAALGVSGPDVAA